MWDINSLKEKQKYVEERLKNCTDNRERELLQLSLVSYSALLNNSGTFMHTQIPNIIDKITQNQFKSKKDIEIGKLEHELFFGNEPYLDEQYLEFLLQLCNNVASTDLVEIEGLSFEPMEVTYENLINMSKSFYSQLGDSEIYEMAMKVLNDDATLNFSTIPRRSMADCSGLTFNDYIFDKSYCTITKKNNVFDYQILNHEVMHGVDFYMQKKIPSENYYGFHEVPTYTIDYLFIDYLEKMGLPTEQVQLLRKQKDNYLQELAKITQNATAPVAGCDGADYSVIGSCSALLLISDSAVSRSPSLNPCVKIVTSLMLFISIQQSLIFSNVSFCASVSVASSSASFRASRPTRLAYSLPARTLRLYGMILP